MNVPTAGERETGSVGPDHASQRFGLIDLIAFVVAQAVGYSYLQVAYTDLNQIPSTVGAFAILIAIAGGIGLTSAGPILLMSHRLRRGRWSAICLGEWFWAWLGLPWWVGMLERWVTGNGRQNDNGLPLLGAVLSLVLVLHVGFAFWMLVANTRDRDSIGPPWSHRLGCWLALAWPMQCGFGLFVLAPHS